MKDKGQERRIQYTIGTSSETVNEGRLLACEVTQLHRWEKGRQERLRQVFLVHWHISWDSRMSKERGEADSNRRSRVDKVQGPWDRNKRDVVTSEAEWRCGTKTNRRLGVRREGGTKPARAVKIAMKSAVLTLRAKGKHWGDLSTGVCIQNHAAVRRMGWKGTRDGAGSRYKRLSVSNQDLWADGPVTRSTVVTLEWSGKNQGYSRDTIYRIWWEVRARVGPVRWLHRKRHVWPRLTW